MALISAILVLELVGGLNLEGHSVGINDGLGHLLNLGPLGGHHVNVVLGVWEPVRAVVPVSYCSTLNSLISASTFKKSNKSNKS